MTTLTLPADVEGSRLEEARRQRTTPELLAIDALRKLFAPPPCRRYIGCGETLLDLSDCIGTVSGTTEAPSENCGQRFAQGMCDKHQRERL